MSSDLAKINAEFHIYSDVLTMLGIEHDFREIYIATSDSDIVRFDIDGHSITEELVLDAAGKVDIIIRSRIEDLRKVLDIATKAKDPIGAAVTVEVDTEVIAETKRLLFEMFRIEINASYKLAVQTIGAGIDIEHAGDSLMVIDTILKELQGRIDAEQGLLKVEEMIDYEEDY